jgi:hypothetical protein
MNKPQTALGMSILDFFECGWILAQKELSPVQKVILKSIMGDPLDEVKPIPKDHPLQETDFANEVALYKYFTGKSEYIMGSHSDVDLLLGRRSGKTLAENVEVLTPIGPVQIKDLKVGDLVYGYNSDGSTSLTPVLKLCDNGIKEVFEIISNGEILAASSEEHRWLTSTYWSNKTNKPLALKTVKEFASKDQYIERRFIKIPCGSRTEPNAYVLGALLGDGCSKNSRGSRDIWISSQNDLIPSKIAATLNASELKRNHETNYNWIIRKDNIEFDLYKSWCKDRYAHEKIADLEIIKTWDRESCLAFMAGLIDTDGSVFLSSDTKNINLSFGMQAKSVVEAYQYLFYKLWQHKLIIHEDTHKDYKNGPVYYVNCKSNLYVKMALKELDPHLVTPSKKWKQEYADYPEQRSDTKLGVRVGASYKVQTYDISLGNETHLFVLANEGLITHNSTLIGAGLALYFATQFDYTPYLRTSPNATIPIISPTKEQAAEVYKTIKSFILRSPYLFNTFLEGKMEGFQEEYSEEDVEGTGALVGWQIKLNNKVVIKVMAADISKIRGMAVPFAILDEVCFFGHDLKGNDNKNTDKGIYEALAPALTQFRTVEGMALILKISSPNGQSGLMYENYERKQEPDVLHFQVPTWYANPKVSLKYLEEQRKKGTTFFNREYGAQYTAAEASYLDPQLIDATIIRGVEKIEPMQHFRYVAAMDYATKDDYWAFGIGHKEYITDPQSKEKKERVYADVLLAWRGGAGAELDPSEIIPEITAWMKTYRVNFCVTDQYAFAALRPFFQREGCNLKEFKVSHQSKLKYMFSLQVAINSGTLKMVHNPLAIRHLKDLREKQSGTGKLRIEHASNSHDDLADVIGLLVYQFDKSSPIYIGMNREVVRDTVNTKDAAGRFVAFPTAQELADHVGVSNFTDSREELEAAKEEQEHGEPGSDEGENGGNGGFFWSF